MVVGVGHRKKPPKTGKSKQGGEGESFIGKKSASSTPLSQLRSHKPLIQLTSLTDFDTIMMRDSASEPEKSFPKA